jgi:hypothetical protein
MAEALRYNSLKVLQIVLVDQEDLEVEEEIEVDIDLEEVIANMEIIIEIITEDHNLHKTLVLIVMRLATLLDNVQNQDKILDLEEVVEEEEGIKEEVMEIMMIEEIVMKEEEVDQEVEVMIEEEEIEVTIDLSFYETKIIL